MQRPKLACHPAIGDGGWYCCRLFCRWRQSEFSASTTLAPEKIISASALKWAAWAVPIALGQGFSNPYGGNTGPSAWEPPLYPYLIGGVFKIFGIYTYASAWVLLSINSCFAVAHHDPGLSDRAQNLRPARRDLVGAGLGAKSLCLVLVYSLDMGHDFYSTHMALIFLVSLELVAWSGTSAGLAGMDPVRRTVGRGSAG